MNRDECVLLERRLAHAASLSLSPALRYNSRAYKMRFVHRVQINWKPHPYLHFALCYLAAESITSVVRELLCRFTSKSFRQIGGFWKWLFKWEHKWYRKYSIQRMEDQQKGEILFDLIRWLRLTSYVNFWALMLNQSRIYLIWHKVVIKILY